MTGVHAIICETVGNNSYFYANDKIFVLTSRRKRCYTVCVINVRLLRQITASYVTTTGD